MGNITAEKGTLIYIMSDRRSGSTLLENILSKSSETISVGELAMLNGHILKKGGGERWDWNCSCGKPVLQCEFWNAILHNKNYFTDDTIPETQVRWNYKVPAMAILSAFPFLLRPLLWLLDGGNKNKRVNETLNKIYNSVFDISGKKIIIDSSKDPDQLTSIYFCKRNYDVKVIWLKKDLRSIAVSKRKWRERNKQKKFNINVLMWVAFFFKRTCYAVSRIIDKKDLFELDYEDLAVNSQHYLNGLTDKFGMLHYDAPTHFGVMGQHTIAGTPERFLNKPIVIDESWKNSFKKNKLTYKVGAVLNKI